MRISAKLVGKRIGNVSGDLLLEVYNQGFTMAEMARQLKTSESTISKLLHSVKVEVRTAGDYLRVERVKVDISKAEPYEL